MDNSVTCKRKAWKYQCKVSSKIIIKKQQVQRKFQNLEDIYNVMRRESIIINERKINEIMSWTEVSYCVQLPRKQTSQISLQLAVWLFHTLVRLGKVKSLLYFSSQLKWKRSMIIIWLLSKIRHCPTGIVWIYKYNVNSAWSEVLRAMKSTVF
jgi:hypothetical protein